MESSITAWLYDVENLFFAFGFKNLFNIIKPRWVARVEGMGYIALFMSKVQAMASTFQEIVIKKSNLNNKKSK